MIEKPKRYKTLEKISEGQFGTVFKGLDTHTNQIVAIKKIYVSLKHSSPAASKVQREIDLMKQINHKNVIRLLDHQVKETCVKLIMDYMDYDLRTFYENMPTPLKNSKVKGIGQMVLEGLQEIHAQGILHRDLKPSNILINAAGEVKIGDFGSAVHLSDTQDGKFEIEGFSRWYKAPEILFGSRTYDFRADIWSFACIFGELLNGSALFAGINDFDQISRIIKVLGTPNKDNWPEVESLPDFGKISFSHHSQQAYDLVFPNAIKSELAFMKYVLAYNRPLNVQQVLNHQYFTEYPELSKYKKIEIVKNTPEKRTDYQQILNLQ